MISMHANDINESVNQNSLGLKGKLAENQVKL
ncbi:MAG: hypothetical protein QG670_1458 [Thermoproteota archaeon]|nr:hypothetical protein [Thermoproteota archaeon]